MNKVLLLMVAASCLASALADCANTFYVGYDEAAFLIPAYAWDLQGGVIRFNSINPDQAMAFGNIGKNVFVLIRQDYSSIGGDHLGEAFVKQANGESESSVTEAENGVVDYYCGEYSSTRDVFETLSFTYGSRLLKMDGVEVNASVVTVSSPRAYAFGAEDAAASNEFVVLAEAAGGYALGTVLLESPAGWIPSSTNRVNYLACCEPECVDVEDGCDSITISGRNGCVNNWLLDYSCTEGGCAAQGTECTDGCSQGACTINPSCADSDGGLFYDEKGTVSTEANEFADYCAAGDSLFEYYCLGASIANKEKACACVDGACVEAVAATPSPSPSPSPGVAPEPASDYNSLLLLGGLALVLGSAYYLLKGSKKRK
ncbi:MAG: hypothetical protein WC607_02170 [Candidatus Micrarchaeia archaeon]